MNSFKKNILSVLLFFCGSIIASDGNLDLSFNNNGTLAGSVITDFGSDANIKAVAVQADGKIVAVGYSNESGQNTFAVFRYNNDGSHDLSFGLNGKVVTRFGRGESASGAQAVVLLPDGKIVAGGFTNAFRNSFRWCVARYKNDGGLDSSFLGGYASVPGTVITAFGTGDDVSQVNDLAVQADGKIVAAGISFTRPHGVQFAVSRYNIDGSLDVSGFNPAGNGSLPGTVRLSLATNGTQHDEAHAVAIQPNGKIVVAGCSFASGVKTFALARLQSNGVLDNSFFSGGLATIPGTAITSFAYGETDGGAHALAIQSDDKIIAAGYTNSNIQQSGATRFALVRYDSQGRLDKSFGGNGLAIIPGTVISSFGLGEKAGRANALALQADGKLVVAGSLLVGSDKYTALARYNVDGSIDGLFNKPNLQKGELLGLAVQADGSIVAAGNADLNSMSNGYLARYDSANTSLLLPIITQPVDGSVIANNGEIEITGNAQNPGLVSVFVNGKLIDKLSVHGKSNQWSTSVANLESGSYTVNAVEQYDAGNAILAGLPISFTVDLNPKGVDASITVAANGSVSGVLQAVGASGKYQFSIISSTNGSVALNGNTYEFRPSIPSGFGRFVFQVTDLVTNRTGFGIVMVTIKELPVATNVELNICQDTTLNGNLNNGISGGVGPYQFAKYGPVSNAAGAIVINSSGAFKFVPKSGFVGDTSFQYRVIDSNGCTSKPATITIHVLQLPVATDANLNIAQDTQLKIDLNQFVSGGTPPYNFVQIGGTLNGTAGIKNSGASIFIPTVGFNGVASYQYQVTDANNCVSNVATISVMVNPLPVVSNEVPSQVEQAIANDTPANSAEQDAAVNKRKKDSTRVASLIHNVVRK